MSIRVHRKAFRATTLLACYRGLSSSRFPIQRNSNPFLLNMCIDAPESTTNSPSSGLRFDGAGRHLFSEREKNAVLCFSFNFSIFWPASTLLYGHIDLVIPSLLETDPQILEHWGYADKDRLGQIIPSDGFWSRMSAWRTTALVNFTHRIGVRMFELFRKIDEDFGGSISWNTQPNCRVIFNKATALLSPFFSDLLLGCSSTRRCAKEHFSTNLHPFSDL